MLKEQLQYLNGEIYLENTSWNTLFSKGLCKLNNSTQICKWEGMLKGCEPGILSKRGGSWGSRCVGFAQGWLANVTKHWEKIFDLLLLNYAFYEKQ